MEATRKLMAVNSKAEHQLALEQLYDKNQLMPRIRRAFEAYESDDDRHFFTTKILAAGLEEKFGFDLLAQMAVRKRANVSTLVGCLRHHSGSSQLTASDLELAVRGGLVDWSARDSQFIVIFGIAKELQDELDRFQFPLPMVIPPQMLRGNLDTGYLTERSSVILRDNHTDDDVCLDHLNRLNRIKFTINLDVANAIQNKWRNLDRKKDDESWEDFKRRKKAFEKYDRVAHDVITTLTKEGNEMYLTHRYDKRGRTYCMGFHLNYQSTDWNKAVLELANAEEVGG